MLMPTIATLPEFADFATVPDAQYGPFVVTVEKLAGVIVAPAADTAVHA
jgi:hypothetical protein